MRQLTYQAKMEALELYLQGLSANEIVAETGISKGAVISIIKDAREGKFPPLQLKDRIDGLHSLSVRLKKEELDLPQMKLGFSFLKRLQEMKVAPDKLNEWIELCSHISPVPPSDFVPAAVELFQIEKETGKSYAEIATEAKELAAQWVKLTSEVRDLAEREVRAKELRDEIEAGKREVDKFKAEKQALESAVGSLSALLQKKAESLGIPLSELQERARELVSLQEEVASIIQEKSVLKGEIEALSERRDKLSSRLEKASADFEKDVKLLKEMRRELARIAEEKGRYEQQIDNMAWALKILPFLSDPDKVQDPGFDLIAIVLNCVDRWIAAQPKFSSGVYLRYLKWEDVKRYVQTKRTGLKQSA